MAKVRLTAGRISGFTTDKPQDFLWDDVTRGLAVRTTAGASQKSFILQTKLAGKSIRVTIGNTAHWDIDKARERARELLQLIDKGIDPREAKRDELAASAQKRIESNQLKQSVREAWLAYIDDRKAKWGSKHLQHHHDFMDPGGRLRTRGRRPGESDYTKPGILVSLMDKPLASIDADTVQAWLKKETVNTPTQAAQAFRALRAFMTWCAESDAYAFADDSACRVKRTKELVPRPNTKADDCLQREQLRPWFDYVRRGGNPVISAFLQILLLVGSRREELTLLKWTDVDFQWNTMTIRDKVDGTRTIPLTPYVKSLIQSLPRRNEWVFSSSGRRGALPNETVAPAGHITEPRIAHVKALKAGGLPHVTLHGLRRSFGTLAEWCEVPVGIVAQIQGHKPSALVEKHYRRRPLDLLRMWHEKIEVWILNEAGIEAPKSDGIHLVRSNAAA
jgi:integrase